MSGVFGGGLADWGDNGFESLRRIGGSRGSVFDTDTSDIEPHQGNWHEREDRERVSAGVLGRTPLKGEVIPNETRIHPSAQNLPIHTS